MESRTRSVVKTASWRVIATALTVGLSYFWFNDWGISITFGIALNVAKSIGFYLHERGWNIIDWGRK